MHTSEGLRVKVLSKTVFVVLMIKFKDNKTFCGHKIFLGTPYVQTVFLVLILFFLNHLKYLC